ncbi:MAG: hypothetical protein ACFE8N_09785, partial [Promethearchaeota archaeon]
MINAQRIVLIGAGSAVFGPPSLIDLYSSKVLSGSTIVLHDINKEKLERVHNIVQKENEIRGNKFTIEQTTNRKNALRGADFVICAIENGDRFLLRRQDNAIPRSYGTTEMMAENGGPGGFFHSARQIPEHVRIGKDIMRYCPEALLLVYSNPISRICLALNRTIPELNYVGLCHQLELLTSYFLPNMLKKSMHELKLTTGGLNHFAFLLGLEDIATGKNLIPEFNAKCTQYFYGKWDRFHYADLTFEIYKRTGYFCYAGDNHVCEYLQFGSHHTKIKDILDWIDRMETENIGVNKWLFKNHKKLVNGVYPTNGILSNSRSGERGIPIIEAILTNKNSHERAVNIPNNGIINNLPSDLVIECS